MAELLTDKQMGSVKMQSKYGTGTIIKKRGKWMWVGYYKDKQTGKIYRPTKTFDTEQEALQFQSNQRIQKTKEV